jgi:hypothetical protein
MKKIKVKFICEKNADLKTSSLQFIASCVLAVANAGYIGQPAIIHAAPVVHAAPIATSYQSSHVVHHAAPVVKA